MEEQPKMEDLVIDELLGRIAMIERDRAILMARVKTMSRRLAEAQIPAVDNEENERDGVAASDE